MLEQYYIRPTTVDRIRGSWISSAIEQYVEWLATRQYRESTISRRIPLLVAYGEFAKSHGARDVSQLPGHVEPFVDAWVAEHAPRKSSAAARRKIGDCVRNPIRQMLQLAIPRYTGRGRPHRPDNPFESQAPQFLLYLKEEKGLRPASIRQYQHHLRQFAAYLGRIGVRSLSRVSMTILSSFVAQYGPRVAWSSLRNACGELRVFFRYLYRERIVPKDLSPLIEFPQSFRHSGIPRSIPWEEVEAVLDAVDRRSVSGKRDYGMLLLLSVYGLRACEVASLTLDDIDWRRERFTIRDRKAGNTTTYPLSSTVGNALIAYIKQARPATAHRQVFLRTTAPLDPITAAAVTCRATYFIRKAGIKVARPGSHTLRHSCVQRLVNARFPLKHIGDYIGHCNSSSTQIYAKVAIEQLREVAQGDGEAIL